MDVITHIFSHHFSKKQNRKKKKISISISGGVCLGWTSNSETETNCKIVWQ